MGIEKDAGSGDTEGDEGGGEGDGDALAAWKQEPQWNDARDGDGGVGGGKGGVFVAAGDPCAVILEAVPAGETAGGRAGAASEDPKDIGGEAPGHRGAEHEKKNADDERALQEPGGEEEEEEQCDDGGEVAPAGEELGDVLDQTAGMGKDPGDYGVIEQEGDGAEEGAGGEEQEAGWTGHPRREERFKFKCKFRFK